jgi:hypothetical protein
MSSPKNLSHSSAYVKAKKILGKKLSALSKIERSQLVSEMPPPLSMAEAGKLGGQANCKYLPQYDKMLVDFFKAPLDAIKGKSVDKLKETMQEFYLLNDFCDLISPPDKAMLEESTLYDWAKKYKSFDDALKKAEKLRRRYLIQMASSGVSNPIFTIFTAKNEAGMKDIVDLQSGGKTITPSFIAHDNTRCKTRLGVDKKP